MYGANVWCKYIDNVYMNKLQETFYKYIIEKKIVGENYDKYKNTKILGKYVLQKTDIDKKKIIHSVLPEHAEHNDHESTPYIKTISEEKTNLKNKTCMVLVKNNIIVKILYLE